MARVGCACDQIGRLRRRPAQPDGLLLLGEVGQGEHLPTAHIAEHVRVVRVEEARVTVGQGGRPAAKVNQRAQRPKDASGVGTGVGALRGPGPRRQRAAPLVAAVLLLAVIGADLVGTSDWIQDRLIPEAGESMSVAVRVTVVEVSSFVLPVLAWATGASFTGFTVIETVTAAE